MFEKLSETEKNYEKIAEDLSTPEVAADPERFAKLMREHKRLTPIVDKYREYVRLKSQIADGGNPRRWGRRARGAGGGRADRSEKRAPGRRA